jgi:hypothetical protein
MQLGHITAEQTFLIIHKNEIFITFLNFRMILHKKRITEKIQYHVFLSLAVCPEDYPYWDSYTGHCVTSGNENAALPDFNDEKMTSLCSEKWSKRGVLDEDMFNYCMNRKTDSYGDLNYLLGQSSDVPGLGNILQYGINYWYEDEGWDMVLYEVKQQIEGYLDVEYF